jgi:hypothetical protein
MRSAVSSSGRCLSGGSLTVIPGCSRKRNSESMVAGQAALRRMARARTGSGYFYIQPGKVQLAHPFPFRVFPIAG